MQKRRIIVFIFEAIVAGLAFAFVLLLLLRPEILDISKTVEFVAVDEDSRINAADISGIVSYAYAVDKAAPAVVNIYTSKLVNQRNNRMYDDPVLRRFFNTPERAPEHKVQNSLGSGVIVNKQGYILTNNHVIQGADEILVAFKDGRSTQAHIIGVDPETDLAVLKINIKNAPYLVFANSSSTKVGDVVLAIGNPFGVGQTVTSGIISAQGRSDLGLSTFENFIQTDAAINPGNSGGALINTQGELIAINTAIFSRSGGSQGIGFAIPTSLAQGVMSQIIEHGRTMRGWLGVEVQDLNRALAESFRIKTLQGAVIAGIQDRGPAARAGIRPGDIVIEADAIPIHNSRSMINVIASRMPGSKFPIKFLREGKEREVMVQIGERPTLQ